ncbi:hypothetical protein K435DRAFT_857691 [Dendrothele bispora CBS 962.96]|uniref:Uncharacterized protein n=1 Tax=Dendrothele bispora (strain CBS 962.96) TaxID=1314807 RepID=A0A4S8M5N9_DENBC|nr:hypothetical protein K435DRAFT_857691 [Dendrothele bispora CBS 962.96]
MASTVSEYFDDAIIRITNDNGSFLLFLWVYIRTLLLNLLLLAISVLITPILVLVLELARFLKLILIPDSGSFSSLPDLVTPTSSSASDSDSMLRISRPATPLPGYEHPPSYSSNMPLFPSFIKLSPITYPLSSSELAYVESSVYDLDQQDLYYKAWANSLWKPHSPFHTPYHRIRLSFLKHATDRFGFHRAEDLYYLSISMGRNRMDTVLAFHMNLVFGSTLSP